MLQEHVKTTKTGKTLFFFAKKIKLVPNKKLLLVLFQPTKHRKKEVCVENQVQGSIGDGTKCFARKTSHNYEKEKPSPFLKKLLRQSQPSTSEDEPKKTKIIPIVA